MKVPFFRPSIGEAEIREVTDTLRSGWLTAGPKTKRFEERFAAAVGGRHGVALNSCTAALHLALEALGLQPGERVIVPTMTFAATAEVVRYLGADPVFVDCEPDTLLMDLDGVERLLAAGSAGVAGVIPVHVGGVLVDMGRLRAIADRYGLWIVEDAAHAFPAAWRPSADAAWRSAGCGESEVACFSFYANKTITCGEGGMAVTDRDDLAERMRLMSLHGMSKDAWARETNVAGWQYEIVAPGFKYNTTDIASAIALCQLERAEDMRLARERVARSYTSELASCGQIELPPVPADRRHSWHLFYIRLRLDRLRVDRDRFIRELNGRGVGTSVHWRPLHLQPYYVEKYGIAAEQLPVATGVQERLISLPIFPGMTDGERTHVAAAVAEICRELGA